MIQHNRVVSSLLLASLAFIEFSSKFLVSNAYPLVLELPAHEETCLRFTLPDDDDAHMVFSALPHDVADKVEDFMVNSLSHLSNENSHVLLHNLPKPPPDIQHLMDEELAHRQRGQNHDIILNVQLAGGTKRIVKNDVIPYFKTISYENVAGGLDQDRKGKDERWDPNSGTYNVCFQNRDHDDLLVIYEFILMSSQEEKRRRKNSLKKSHFEPLEEVYEESLALGQSILDEMINIQARDALMQHKSDMTSTKVRLMSLVSIGVLVVVTYIQVTYLKSYFRKKKVL